MLHVITGLAAGGAEQQLRLLLKHTRYPADVLSLVPGGSVAEALASDGVLVSSLAMRGNRDVTALWRLVQILRVGRYDVVHVHLYRACIYGRIAARLARVPVVVTTEHSIGDERIEGRRKTACVRALYLATERLTDVTIAPSLRVRQRLVSWGVPAARIRVIPIGLQLDDWSYDEICRQRIRQEMRIADDVSLIGVVGRLEAVKQVDVAIRALAPILGQHTQLIVAGDGSQRAYLERLTAQVGVAAHVRFLGERRDVPDLLSAFDVLVSTSQEETFGVAILEALASGLPVVYRTAPALEEMARRVEGADQVEDVSTGLLPAVQERLRTVDNIGRLLQNPSLQAYDVARVAADTDSLYQALYHGGS